MESPVGSETTKNKLNADAGRFNQNRSESNRQHHWDAFRAVLMLLGIPYHVALTYRIGQVWILDAREGMAGLSELAEFIHLFRMPAFFVIAGYFSALLLARRAPGQWLRGRLFRLGIPLAVAMLTLNPLLNMACELSGLPAAEAVQSWLRNSAESGGYWVRHLWFLIVLLYYSLAASLLVWRLPALANARVSPRRDALLARWFLPFWLGLAMLFGLWEAVSIELFYKAGLATNLPQQILRIDETLQYLPWFLLGWLMARAPAFHARLYRLSPVIVITAATFTALAIRYGPVLWPPYGRFLATVAGLCLTQVALVLLRRVASQPSASVRSLVDASFVVYLFHLPILAGLVVLMQPLAMHVALKAALVALLTFLLSWGCWAAVSRSPLLRLLYDGVRTKPGRTTRAQRPLVVSVIRS